VHTSNDGMDASIGHGPGSVGQPPYNASSLLLGRACSLEHRRPLSIVSVRRAICSACLRMLIPQQPTYLVVLNAAVIRCRILSFAESFVPVFSAGKSLDGWSQVSTSNWRLRGAAEVNCEKGWNGRRGAHGSSVGRMGRGGLQGPSHCSGLQAPSRACPPSIRSTIDVASRFLFLISVAVERGSNGAADTFSDEHGSR